jgi:group II intron reverse transcriptase/maturase
VQEPTTLLAILGKMAKKPGVRFHKLYQKLYNPRLWMLAYQSIAPKPGNMTPGTDGHTIDGMGMRIINGLIADLKASRYKPTPVRRVYIPKANGKLRPLGIPSFRDKLLQTGLKLLLEAIYEPVFSEASHGFRPGRSCHTALEHVKKDMTGTRWWVEGDIKGFFDHVQHDTLLRILGKRITDSRLLHLLHQLLQAGYMEDWVYHRTYSGTPQGGNLSPLLANIYLHELDEAIAQKQATFNTGRARRRSAEYHRLNVAVSTAKKRARQNGNWSQYKALKKASLVTPSVDHQDSSYRRLFYVRYADDFLLGIIGTKDDAAALRSWLETFLRDELHLELSVEKTLITHATKRVRFLGYDVRRWTGVRIVRFITPTHGTVTRRTGPYQLRLLMPRDKTVAFAQTFGDTATWRGTPRTRLLNLSELEILLLFNAEVRGFLGYYSLADNLTQEADKVLWLTTTSFFCTLAAKRRSQMKAVACSLKQGAGRYAVLAPQSGGTKKAYELVSSTRQLPKRQINYDAPDLLPNLMRYQSKTELGTRLLANRCEWCNTQEGLMEVHHVRKLGNLKGRTVWERQMIQRRRKTLILCVECHDELHAGKLNARKRMSRENRRAGYTERCPPGSEGSSVKPGVAIC